MENHLKRQIENSVDWYLTEGLGNGWINYKHYICTRYSRKYKGKGKMAKILAYAIKVHGKRKLLGDCDG